jgi:hypothetical protein
MEEEVVAGVGVQVRREFGVFPDGAGRLLKDTLALAITDNVISFSSDSLVTL